MSHHATNWAVTQRGLHPATKVLLWQLADRHNPDHGCFPDQDRLAADCEMSRSSVNEHLNKLELAGLLKRIRSRHPVTKRQQPTRYVFAFEPGFSDLANGPETEGGDEPSPESRVQNPDTENEPSRVQNEGRAESENDPEPSPAGRTHNRGTSKLTGKGTSKRAVGADRGVLFEKIWKGFPLRPGSPMNEAWEIFQNLDEGDLAAVERGAERYAQWFREEAARKGMTLTDAAERAYFLANWLKGGKWIDAASLPVSAKPGSEAAKALEGSVSVNKWSHRDLFEECERVKGKTVPVGKSGSWSFPVDVVAEARKRLGIGPP